MSVKNQGWTEIMAGNVGGLGPNSLFGKLLNGRAVMGIDGSKIDLGTLGGLNSWMNWGEINDPGQIVGYSETNVPDPNGEDLCGFGTHLTCRAFLWQDFQMSALPILGGNNGQASGINNRGQIAGFAETTTEDSGCPPNRTTLGVLWEKGQPQPLPPVGSDPDAVTYGINDQGQVVGYSGTCTAANQAVLRENGTAIPLPDLGTKVVNQAWGINNQGQIVGQVTSPDGQTEYAALWQNGELTNLRTLPGDFGAPASGINSKGQVVGSTWDSNFNWSHGFIYQNGVMTDLNTLMPANSNLYAAMANKINERGQISGMAIVLSGPDAGNIHAILLTTVNESIRRSIADVAPTHPKSNVPANVGKQLLPRFGLVHRFRRSRHSFPWVCACSPLGLIRQKRPHARLGIRTVRDKRHTTRIFFVTKNFLQAAIRFCSGSDIICYGSSKAENSACTLCKEERVAAVLSTGGEEVCAHLGLLLLGAGAPAPLMWSVIQSDVYRATVFRGKAPPHQRNREPREHSQQPQFLTRPTVCDSNDQTALSIFMSRVRHCVECPKCRTRYLPGSSPYRNGSYLIPLTAHRASGWILYCSCRMPPASSQWSPTDLKPYDICRQAYHRGYGSPDEVDVT